MISKVKGKTKISRYFRNTGSRWQSTHWHRLILLIWSRGLQSTATWHPFAAWRA